MPGTCFDFSEPVRTTLQQPVLDATEEPAVIGGNREGLHWAEARIILPLPFPRVHAWLRDHANWKDTTRVVMRVSRSDRPRFLEGYRLDLDLPVLPFVTISWSEEWVYELLAGTPEEPTEILVSYQKIGGTGYIEQLCGSVRVKRLGPLKTDVLFYEQGRAAYYDTASIEKMHRENMRALLELATREAPPRSPRDD